MSTKNTRGEMRKKVQEWEDRLAEAEGRQRRLVEEHAQEVIRVRTENADKLKELEESIQAHKER
jgi:hypothetical protein